MTNKFTDVIISDCGTGIELGPGSATTFDGLHISNIRGDGMQIDPSAKYSFSRATLNHIAGTAIRIQPESVLRTLGLPPEFPAEPVRMALEDIADAHRMGLIPTPQTLEKSGLAALLQDVANGSTILANLISLKDSAVKIYLAYLANNPG